MGLHLSEAEWQRALIAHLKAAMREREMDFPALSKELAKVGVELERVPLANKINRGSFSAGFLLQVLSALGIRALKLDDIARATRIDE